MAAAAKCSKYVPPILKRCLLFNNVIDGNITTTYTSRVQPKAQNLDQCLMEYLSVPYHSMISDTSSQKGFTVTDLSNVFSQPHKGDLICDSSRHDWTIIKSTTLYNGSSIESAQNDTPGSPTPSTELSFVLLKLREELPHFFRKRHSVDIYDSQLKFINMLFPLVLQLRTLSAYKMYLGMCRYLTVALYSNATFELIKITKEDKLGQIKARWRIQGCPRPMPWLSQRVILDGFSTFKVDSKGKVYLHKVEKIMPSTKEKTRLSLWFAQIGLITGLSAPGPTK